MGIFITLLLFLLSVGSQAVSDFGQDWSVETPHPDRAFLTHKKSRTFILLTKFKTRSPAVKFEEYFADGFSEDALNSRKEILEVEGDEWRELVSGSDTHEGVRYGGTSFKTADATFYERIWTHNNHVWHMALVTLDKLQAHDQMNNIMGRLNTSGKTSFFKSLSLNAYAGEEECSFPTDASINHLHKIVKPLHKNSACQKQKIHPSKLGDSYGLKLKHGTSASCLIGSKKALNAMKNGFLSVLDSWSEETQKQILHLHCREPVKQPGFLATFAYSAQMDMYEQCLSSAAILAGASIGAQALNQTASSLKALYRWVKTEKDPAGVITSILASKYEGFMCLNAKAQMDAVCEFSTNFLVGLAGTATGAGAAIAIKKGITSVRKLASIAGPGQGRALKDAHTKVNGVSVTFKSPDPFVKLVSQGKAEAARVAKALSAGAILQKSPAQMDKVLKAQGFTRIDTCIKMDGKCVTHKNPLTGKDEIAPMVVYVHPSGLAARLKPHGQSNAKFRQEPHGSFMLVNPEESNLAEALKKFRQNPTKPEEFMDKHLSWNQELAKIDMSTGTPLPSSPGHTKLPADIGPEEAKSYNDALSNLTHFSLR